jgi:ubiquinone/menaquinone biosynthesis C-methylase UbiE
MAILDPFPDQRIKPVPPGVRITISERLFRLLYPLWAHTGIFLNRKRRRVDVIIKLMESKLLNSGRILEIGCANGQDFVRLFRGRSDLEIYGMDLEDYHIQQDNFTLIQGDAEQINYPDKYFDVTVSIGVLEHIQPIEKLCRVISEIDRVSKSYCIIVPSIGTILEPHTAKIFWQIRDHNKKAIPYAVNYFSDEAWLQFMGFHGASVHSFWYIPFVLKNLAIYKVEE